jgi:hypothetical protein
MRGYIETAAVQQAESSASRLRAQRDEEDEEPPRRERESSIHQDPSRRPVRERIQDNRGSLDDGDARNIINNAAREAGRNRQPRRGGRHDSDEDRDDADPPGPRAFSREIHSARFPFRFRQPANLTKYSGESTPEVWLNDYRLACQLGGADDDRLIIRNLPLHLGDSARAWLEHLPTHTIRDWSELVKVFVGNF